MKRTIIFLVLIAMLILLFLGIGNGYLTYNGEKFVKAIPIVEGQAITDREVGKLYTNLKPEQYEQDKKTSRNREYVHQNPNMFNPFSQTYTFLYDATELALPDGKTVPAVSASVLTLQFAPDTGWKVEKKTDYQIYNNSMDQAKKLVEGQFWNNSKDDIVDLTRISKTLETLDDEQAKLDKGSSLYEVKNAIFQVSGRKRLLEVESQVYGAKTPGVNDIKKEFEIMKPLYSEIEEKYRGVEATLAQIQKTKTPEVNQSLNALYSEWIQKALANINDEYVGKVIEKNPASVDPAKKQQFIDSKDQRAGVVTQNTTRIEEIKGEIAKK
jgi:hypothetical protein